MAFQYRFRRQALSVASIAALLSAAPVAALADEIGDAAATEVDQIVVTGSRVARTVESSPAPIDVLGEVALEKTNKGNLLETLNTLLPSFNLPNVATPNVGSMIRAGQLRGLNPSHTLVLVNGKRRHGTAFLGAGGFAASAPADLSLIASGSIERIEVLRDGASAIYGSDAIAGVINIITNKDDQGGSASARVGQFYEGDGFTRVFKADAGFKLGDKGGYLHLAGQVDDQEIVIRNSPIPSSFLFYFPLNAAGKEILPAGVLSTNPSLPAGATPNPKEASRNNNAWINQGAAPYRLETLSLDVGLPLTDTVEAYGFATYARRESSAPQNFRHPSRDEVVRAIFPNGFTPVEAIEEKDYEVTAGLKGKAFDWDWDLSTSYGRDQVDVHVHNSLNPTFGLQSQTDFYIGRHEYSAWTTNLDFRRSVEWGVPVDLAFGLEHRRETYALSKGDFQSYSYGGATVLDGPNAGKVLGKSLGGSQALPGYRPEDETDVSRDSTSVYVGAAVNLTPDWVIDVAGRYEDYSDFGDTSTWRITSRYDFGKWLAVRGTVSTGFNAPALAAQGYKNTGNQNTFVNHVLQVGSPEARALGAQPLKPETSTSYSIGVVSSPTAWLNLALDLYQIDVEDRIAQSTTIRQDLFPASAAAVKALVAAAGFDPNDGISYFINAANSRTKGFDLTIDATTDTERFGRFRWSAAINRNEARVTKIAPTPAVLAAFNVPVFNAAAQTNIRYQAPLGKEILGVVWTYGPWTVNLRETHYGKIKRNVTVTTPVTTGPYAGVVGEIPYDVGKLWVTDLDVTFDVNEQFSVAVSANNLFDKKPPQVPAPALAAYQAYSYTNSGPVGVGGGFYSATLRYKW
ncbi:TonB-dependent receptor plug domain-containing protein [Phenylobacterium sp.]|jgi:iron complex outermembrane receptor protein|uniref:TonB-dependent receptor plug domain-containing protein n=1 Tax=Phenylobacterium sp. TaxID=1871053 RepID=UPI0035AFAF0E